MSAIPAATPAVLKPVPTTGPEAIYHALNKLNLDALEKEQWDVIHSKKVSKRPRAVAVLGILDGMKKNNITPSDFFVKNVPVIPTAFRPYSTVGSVFVPGDANELYGDLFKFKEIYERTKEVLGDKAAAESKADLYRAAKALYGYGDPVSNKLQQRGVVGFLKTVVGAGPKHSVVQSRLLSKPQDSVSRGTIIAAPHLSMDEVEVPDNMAWTMYAPYIQRRLIQAGFKPVDALRHIKERTEQAKRFLIREMDERPVIYSRDPAWHKYNILAGKPKLVEGHVIGTSPIVMAGMSGDYDGDTVSIHLPSSRESVKEAWEKLLPSKMLYSIRDQDKLIPVPRHEDIWGVFDANKRPPKNTWAFKNEKEALNSIKAGHVSLQDEIEVPD